MVSLQSSHTRFFGGIYISVENESVITGKVPIKDEGNLALYEFIHNKN